MTATVTVIAEYREHKARVEWVGDPLVWARAWLDFWAGARK